MKYNIVLADPPWWFRNYSADAPGEIHDRSRGAAKYYPTMKTIDIMSIPVNLIAEDNALLFLWSVWPLLPDALQVIKAWGFEYKTIAWVWVKANKSGMGFFTGMGYYTRSNSEPCLFATRGDEFGSEPCLLATRGKVQRPENKGIQSLIYSSVREHSRKPDDQYRKIESLYPGKKYLELFARRERSGWSSWGNEVEGVKMPWEKK